MTTQPPLTTTFINDQSRTRVIDLAQQVGTYRGLLVQHYGFAAEAADAMAEELGSCILSELFPGNRDATVTFVTEDGE